ncbi:hypothetical protein Csa_017501, partial [Cucumis sativus]
IIKYKKKEKKIKILSLGPHVARTPPSVFPSPFSQQPLVTPLPIFFSVHPSSRSFVKQWAAKSWVTRLFVSPAEPQTIYTQSLHRTSSLRRISLLCRTLSIHKAAAQFLLRVTPLTFAPPGFHPLP